MPVPVSDSGYTYYIQSKVCRVCACNNMIRWKCIGNREGGPIDEYYQYNYNAILRWRWMINGASFVMPLNPNHLRIGFNSSCVLGCHGLPSVQNAT